jgi:hypothetical protein
MKSMKDLKSLKIEAQAKPVQRTQASITSPCLAIDDSVDSNSNETTDANTTKQDNQVKTVDDAAQEVIQRLFK